MEGTSEDLWTPYKELQNIVEKAASSENDLILDVLQKTLQKHKQNFLTLQKNAPKNAKSREELSKATTEGIRLGGVAHQILPQELVDEIIIISDMYDLNEYMVLDLLTTAQQQMPYHPGLTRGLVAVLLYYDGRKSLATALRILMQARHGLLWTVEAAPEITHFITAFTKELLDKDLIKKILSALAAMDAAKEMELLQKNRALGGAKHHHQVVELFQETRQQLADIVYLTAAQGGLAYDTTAVLIEQLQMSKLQTDSSGGIDGVTLALQMALLYVLDVGVLQRREDGEELLGKMALINDPNFMPQLLKEFSPQNNSHWECEGLKALTQLALAVTMTSLRMAPPNIQPQGVYEEDEILIDSAINLKVFQFLNNTFLINETIYKEEFYLRRMHFLLTDFIIQMPLKLKELRNKAEEAAKTYNAYMQEGLDPPVNLSQGVEQLLLSLSRLYSSDPLNLQLALDFWCAEGVPQTYSYRTPPRQVSLFKFVRQSAEGLQPTLFVPYMKMLVSLVSCPSAARQAFSLLKNNKQSNITWDHFFNSLNRYYTNLRQELPPMTDTVYRHRNYSKGITPLEIQGLQAVLALIRTVAEHDEVSRLALCENSSWAPLFLLLGLVSCSIQINLKADLLLTLAALAQSPSSAAALWHNLEASQILVTVPSTSSFQPRGIQTELEEVECRNEEFPLTRAMLRLLDVLTDVPVPRLLGVGARTPGFDPYLTFVLHNVFLRFHNRSYKNQQEKWEVCRSCLHLLVKFLMQYEPKPDDFVATKVQLQGGGATCINPPPGYHLMAQLCSKSELFRLVMKLIDEGCHMLDSYTLFAGKSTLEAATLLCLRLLDQALRLQQRYLVALSAAGSSLLLHGLNKLLLGINTNSGKPDHLLNIAKYVTYNQWLPSHCLYAVRIYLAVTLYPGQQSHMVSILTGTQLLTTQIRHGFVECLEADDEQPSGDEDEMTEVCKTKEAILKLLLQCLGAAPPNLAHYLLGFDLEKDISATNFQQPGVLGFPMTCLHAVMSLLSASLRSHTDVTSPCIHPRLTELCYRLIYSLAANVLTSEPTLRFLRSSGDFIQKHLAALPFSTANKGCDLTQAAWLLKTVAIELKVTAAHQQMSQLASLINVLVLDKDAHRPDRHLGATVQLTHSFKTDLVDLSAPYKRLILQLLGVVSFHIEPVKTPAWEFFEHGQMDALTAQCEVGSSGGLKVIDVKRLHRLLMDELAVVQGSSTIAHRQLILREIQSVLAHAVKQNKQRHLASATVQYLDAWRQVTEVLFSVAPNDSLPFPLRFSLLLQIIFELLTKVLNSTVMTELATLSSGAVLLLFVSLCNCFTAEMNKLSLQTTSDDAWATLSAFLQAKENILKDIMSCMLKWILSSVSSQKLRANLYAALLSFLQLSREQCEPLSARSVAISGSDSSYVSMLDEQRTLQPVWVSKHSSLQVLLGFGERLLVTLCQDFSGGHDICKMLALSCLDLLVELDPHGYWISFLSSRGYLKFLIDNLLAADNELIELLSPSVDNLRPLYVYESKMALLCRVAATHSGAELLLEQNCLACLSTMQVFDNHPDVTHRISHSRMTEMELDFVPSVSCRYLQILSPALTLCQTVLSSLGVENQSAISQVIHFLLSHGDMVTQVLRCGSPFLQLNYLRELQQLTAVIARATNQEVVRKMSEEAGEKGVLLESTSHFHKIQRLMLGLLSRFVLSEATLKDLAGSVDPDRTNPMARAQLILMFMQVSGNLAMYARNLVSSSGLDKPATAAILQPSLLEPTAFHKKEISMSRETSLGVVVQQMVQCVAHFHREKVSLDLLTRKFSSIGDLNSTTIKELLPAGSGRMGSLDESKQQVYQMLQQEVQDKRLELESCQFIVENCLYLVWAHLDYYMLQAIPSKTLGIDKPKGRTAQMGELNWCVTVEELNKLKQGLISVFNDTFCKNLISVTQELSASDRGFVEALVRRIKKLIQFVPNK